MEVEGRGQEPGTILEETRALVIPSESGLVEASQVFTVSMLIFVGWIPPFIGASCPHSLGSDFGAGLLPLPVPNVIVHGPAARSLTAAAHPRGSQRTRFMQRQSRLWCRHLPEQGPHKAA